MTNATEAQARIRVLVVDDHAVMRSGLVGLLTTAADIEVVADVADAFDALTAVRRHAPDVVLMDISMPGTDGIESTRQVLRERPETQVVMLTSYSDSDRVLDALGAGAVGYLLKDAEPDDILRGVRAAGRGESPLDPRVARAVLSNRAQRRPLDELTDREREVLALVARGLANKQIAWRLGISEKTVKTHLTSVFQRIGVADRTQAALWAQRMGLAGQ